MKIIPIILIGIIVISGVYALSLTEFNNWLNNKIAQQEAIRIANELNQTLKNTTIQGNLIITGNIIVKGCIKYEGGTLGKCI